VAQPHLGGSPARRAGDKSNHQLEELALIEPVFGTRILSPISSSQTHAVCAVEDIRRGSYFFIADIEASTDKNNNLTKYTNRQDRGLNRQVQRGLPSVLL